MRDWGRDWDRRRLAEFLHDEVIQSLLAANSELGSAIEGEGELEPVGVALDRAVGQLRDLASDLYPQAVERGGLSGALQAIAKREAGPAGIDFTVLGDASPPPAIERLLFSIGRELIINVVKHARARELRVTLAHVGPEVALEVSDEGSGIPPGRVEQAAADGHLGLAACRERAEEAGGSLTIDTAPWKGTSVRVVVPAVTSHQGDSERRRDRAARRADSPLPAPRSPVEGSEEPHSQQRSMHQRSTTAGEIATPRRARSEPGLPETGASPREAGPLDSLAISERVGRILGEAERVAEALISDAESRAARAQEVERDAQRSLAWTRGVAEQGTRAIEMLRGALDEVAGRLDELASEAERPPSEAPPEDQR